MDSTQEVIATRVVVEDATKRLVEAKERSAAILAALRETEAERDRLAALTSLNAAGLLSQENVRRKLRTLRADAEAAVRALQAAQADLDTAEVDLARAQLPQTRAAVERMDEAILRELRPRTEAVVRDLAERLKEREPLVIEGEAQAARCGADHETYTYWEWGRKQEGERDVHLFDRGADFARGLEDRWCEVVREVLRAEVDRLFPPPPPPPPRRAAPDPTDAYYAAIAMKHIRGLAQEDEAEKAREAEGTDPATGIPLAVLRVAQAQELAWRADDDLGPGKILAEE